MKNFFDLIIKLPYYLLIIFHKALTTENKNCISKVFINENTNSISKGFTNETKISNSKWVTNETTTSNSKWITKETTTCNSGLTQRWVICFHSITIEKDLLESKKIIE